MYSLKFKFTLFITLLVFGVALLVTTITYGVNIRGLRGPISAHELNKIVQNNPKVKIFIEEEYFERVQELSRELRARERDKLTVYIMYSLPISLFISFFISYMVSSYLVRPIEDVTRRIRLIQAQADLKARLPQNKSSAEIEYLVETFNNLLSSYEATFNAQEQFLQDAAHELRTPISAMKTSLDVFGMSPKHKSSDYSHLFAVVGKLNDKLNKLVENLLYLNKVQDQNVIYERININDLITDVLESLEGLLLEQKIDVKLDLSSTLPKIAIDISDGVRLMNNLIENAIKYNNADDKHIYISTYTDGDKVVIKLKDNGIGIGKTDLPKIFDRFYRSGDLASDSQGEGLGLSIVKKIVDKYKAEIKVDSELGQGTEFIIIFPKA